MATSGERRSEERHRDCDLDGRQREQLFQRAEQQVFDLIVIGGGITGAGVAREATAQGLSVALLEANDLASGTSSRSSKMIHGGVRYLAQGDIPLVREAANERQILRRIAPHLTRFMPFLLPTRSAAGQAKFRTAMWTFEKLGQIPKAERHRVWNRTQLEENEPLSAVEGANGGVVYFEFLTDDARLTLANARSAAAGGALVLTHCPVEEIVVEGGRAVAVGCKSAIEGESMGAVVRGRAIVNAAGPWVDAIRALEDGGAEPKLSVTKGSHLVFPRSLLPISRTVLMSAVDRRPVFAVPRQEVTYVGTTDTFHSKPERWPAITSADVGYLLAATARSLSVKPLQQSDVIASWTGIRPLISQVGKSPSEVSRRDEVWTGPAGILSIAGGKLTAYRAMAERVVLRVSEQLGHTLKRAPTALEPLVGGDFAAPPPDPDVGVSASGEDRLIELYGSEAADVVADGGDVEAEVRQAVRREGALRLEDYWMRRSARAYFDLDAGLPHLERASKEMAALLGWHDLRRRAEVDACHDRHRHDNALFTERSKNDSIEERTQNA